MKPINREFTPIVGMALATKDGQRCGNGFVVMKEVTIYTLKKSELNGEIKETVELFHVLTDFGNVMKLTKNEVNELFDVASWWDDQAFGGEFGNGPQFDNFMCPVARIKRQMKLLVDVLKELE